LQDRSAAQQNHSYDSLSWFLGNDVPAGEGFNQRSGDLQFSPTGSQFRWKIYLLVKWHGHPAMIYSGVSLEAYKYASVNGAPASDHDF